MTEISIKNFQSIESVSFAVDGFTLIIGKNNIGKSAIIRSINSALTNQAGDEFIKKGRKVTEVILKRNDLNIHWKKGTKASYVVNGESFTALGRGGIPKPIIDAGFKNIEIGDLKINPLYAPQFETANGNGPVFLLNKPGSQITEILSKIYDIDVISKADDLCQKEIRSVKNLQKTRASDLESLDAELIRFRDFESIRKDVREIQELESKCLNLRQEISFLSEKISEFVQISQTIQRLKKITEIKIPDLSAYGTSVEQYRWISLKSNELFELTKKVESLKKISQVSVPNSSCHDAELQAVAYLEKINKELKNQAILVKTLKNRSSYLNEILPILTNKSSSIESGLADVSWLLNVYKNMMSLKESYNELQRIISNNEADLKALEAERSSYKSCPVCGSPLNGGKV